MAYPPFPLGRRLDLDLDLDCNAGLRSQTSWEWTSDLIDVAQTKGESDPRPFLCFSVLRDPRSQTIYPPSRHCRQVPLCLWSVYIQTTVLRGTGQAPGGVIPGGLNYALIGGAIEGDFMGTEAAFTTLPNFPLNTGGWLAQRRGPLCTTLFLYLSTNGVPPDVAPGHNGVPIKAAIRIMASLHGGGDDKPATDPGVFG